MPYKVVGTPVALRDTRTNTPTLSGITDLQYAGDAVMGVRQREDTSEWEIIRVYTRAQLGGTAVLGVPDRKALIDVEDRILGGKNVFGATIAAADPDPYDDTSPTICLLYTSPSPRD